MAKGDARARYAAELFDLLASEPGSLTGSVMRDRLGWRSRRFEQAVHDVRITLGDDDTINLVATSQPGGGEWHYELTGAAAIARPWQANRLVDLDSRIRTMRAVASSLRRALDARTVDGRRAKVLARTLDYLIETLDDLDGWHNAEPT